jgi:4-hydroxybenzoate polyprenyltransferase
VKRTLLTLAKLTRFDEYTDFIVITTLLGVLAAEGSFTWQLMVLLFTNWLAVGFAFMINDIEDAPEDAFSKKNYQRNPVSSGLISQRDAKIAAWLAALSSAGLYALLGLWPFILGVICLILGMLFSAQTVRLKTMAFMDILSHGLIVAGLPFLSSYFTFTTRFNQVWFWPFIFVVSISNYRRLQKEIRNIEGERLSRLRHRTASQGTAIVLGDRVTSVLMMVMLILAAITGVITFLLINLIPTWVMVVMVFLVIVFVRSQRIKNQRGDSVLTPAFSFTKPLEQAAALALILQFFIPWLDQLMRLGIF